ncbi:hypothetical protein AGABI2DRAFT_208152 [Agaricus bisporus var. bisporus H97]|uniref:hypothetical protein n=1 Tax=Agaricus bisporus var. bisporus (strain H97 / ATCC MYA-4626 / FGSC 10389) TaxID=936046 RepID=UPI00029F53E4|nr:hypothetical protein AGABI2DRAFT_208152 [Agaricus bisporus var. bisporus H97]EKV45252.1 hypothetical protein AGABI2DRAFT_208152 [Agaricus bisporus var. bisporus H97]
MASAGQPKLTDFKVLVFDVYGTLADWESGIYEGLKPLFDQYPAQKWDRKAILAAYSAVEHDLAVQFPDMLYSDLLAKISETLEGRLKAQAGNSGSATTADSSAVTSAAGGTTATTSSAASSTAQTSTTSSDANHHVTFGRSIPNWHIFPDSSAALHELAKDYKLVVLSNVDHDSFRHTHAKLSLGSPASNAQELETYTNPLSSSSTSAVSAADEHKPLYAKYWHPQETPNSRSPFSLVLTAQDTKCYKPALGGFNTVLECIGTDPTLLGNLGLSAEQVKEKVLIVAQSLTHDHEAAHQLGLTSAWIDRQDALTCREAPVKRWTWKFETLGQMAEAVAKEKKTLG